MYFSDLPYQQLSPGRNQLSVAVRSVEDQSSFDLSHPVLHEQRVAVDEYKADIVIQVVMIGIASLVVERSMTHAQSHG